MSEIKRIVIVGGGYAGISVAKTLNKKYKKNPAIEIVLIDKKPHHTLMTELHEIAGMRTEPESVQVLFRKIFGGTKVKVLTDTVISIDYDQKKVQLTNSSLDWDHIVIGTGAQTDYLGVPGVKEHSFALWSFEEAMDIRRHLESIWERAAAEPHAEKRKKMLTFVVAGAGFTGVEMMGELLELKKVMCKKHFIAPSEVTHILVEAMPNILTMLDEKQREQAFKYLEKKGCEIRLSSPIVGAEQGLIKIKDGSTIETDTFIWTCGVKGNQFAEDQGFESKNKRIITNSFLQVPERNNVWVAGDNLWFIEKERPLPQIVETAHQTGELVGHNISAVLENKPLQAFKSNFHGFMVSIGSKYAVANAGGIRTSGFIAMALKHLINLFYLFTITGINQPWEYIKHEFLDIKHNRSFIGGFASYKIRGYWPVLLRMYLGFSWFSSGLNKIGEGWLNAASGSKTSWMFSPGVVQSGVKPAGQLASTASVDLASSASEWVEEVVEVVSPAVTDVVSSASEWVEHAGTAVAQGASSLVETSAKAFGPILDLAKPIFNAQGIISTWFRTSFMDTIFVHLPYSWLQLMVVATEIIIGLALFGGAFTWLAAAVSIVLCIMFTLSGMFAWEQLWYVFAAVLCMGGVGRAFGLDYWIMPFIKKIWNGFPWVRRHHLYVDEPSK